MTKKKPAKESLRTSEEELAIIEQLFLLNGGTLLDFRPVAPPPSVRGVIKRANLQQLQGALVEVLSALRSKKWEGSHSSLTGLAGDEAPTHPSDKSLG